MDPTLQRYRARMPRIELLVMYEVTHWIEVCKRAQRLGIAACYLWL